MHAVTVAMKHEVAASQGKPASYLRYAPEWERKHHSRVRKRDEGNAWNAFAAPIYIYILQLHSRQPCCENSGTGYGEGETDIAKSGDVGFRIAECKAATFCHTAHPSDSSASGDSVSWIAVREAGSTRQQPSTMRLRNLNEALLSRGTGELLYVAATKDDGRLSWILIGMAGRRNVAEGNSPNSAR